MEIYELEEIANKEKLNIVNWKMKKNKARITNSYIFMDYSKIDSDIDEKCILAEELGHYYYSSYYTFNSSQNEIERAEYKANKWKCTALVTKNALKEALMKGCNTFYEIAEELSVNEETAKFAYNYYKENGLIYTEDEMLRVSI